MQDMTESMPLIKNQFGWSKIESFIHDAKKKTVFEQMMNIIK